MLCSLSFKFHQNILASSKSSTSCSRSVAEDLMSESAVMEPGGPVAPVLDQHVTSSEQSEHLGGDGEVDVAALLGEINTMNQ